ncbi:MAG TPA: exosortase/archaeosortase family protein [Bryobacteraceae bacterium]|nr:exosortase/archaeosortase family protein [Bryobacteraceae bacterium]
MATTLIPERRGGSIAALPPSPSYGRWLQVGIVVGLMAFLFVGVLANMAHDWWTDPAWSQGLLLPPLAFYVAWIHRSRTFSVPAEMDRRGLFVTAFACLSFLAGRLASEEFTTRISFVVLLTGVIWTFWGLKRLKTLAFPMLLLATMVPLPALLYNSLAAPLQLFASDLGSRVAQAAGIALFRDGNIIQLANISLGVEEACSGLNSLSALCVGALLFGYINCSRLVNRIAVFLLAIPLAIAINVLRIAGTAILADYNQDFAMGFYHMFSGWLVFVVGATALYLFAQGLHAVSERS